MSSMFDRTKIVCNNLDKIKNLNICVCGIGGVGSYVVEGLVRSGVTNLTIIDDDVIDITNKNRQLFALDSTIGIKKVDVAYNRVRDINRDVNITKIDKKITVDDVLINDSFDYVVDCIDDINAKIALIKFCYIHNIKIISCMGMGNRIHPELIEITDIYKTSNCPLARKVRGILKKENINKLLVVYSKELPLKSSVIGSTSYVPSVAGLYIVSEIINENNSLNKG
ncbi:MAG: tRNA threonylcarbamoyladenosine dehydratase [Clostridia bacterium]